jgi:hypothetical protein
MPRRAELSMTLIAAASMATAPAHAWQAPSPPGWTLHCRAGEDGFAHNCEAIRPAGDYALRLATADSQVFVMIRHPRCETNYRSWDRTEMIGLAPAERRAEMARAVREIEAEIRSRCPTLAPPALALDAMPDIAILPPATDD